MFCNKGVKCDVEDCEYNIQNCECAKETIQVSKGQDLSPEEKPLNSPHFCKSYKKKES